jgi:hypothetical protein
MSVSVDVLGIVIALLFLKYKKNNEKTKTKYSKSKHATMQNKDKKMETIIKLTNESKIKM